MQVILIKAVAAIVGGGGGGRPNMAQAGGRNPEKADEAIAAASWYSGRTAEIIRLLEKDSDPAGICKKILQKKPKVVDEPAGYDI